MSRLVIDEFAEKLVKCVRDHSIESFDAVRVENKNSPTTRAFLANCGDNLENVIDNIVPLVVDSTIFHFLSSVDNGDINIMYKSDAGEMINLGISGMAELGGHYLDDDKDGWKAKFSQLRAT